MSTQSSVRVGDFLLSSLCFESKRTAPKLVSTNAFADNKYAPFTGMSRSIKGPVIVQDCARRWQSADQSRARRQKACLVAVQGLDLSFKPTAPRVCSLLYLLVFTSIHFYGFY
jgi:hypothetical protein